MILPCVTSSVGRRGSLVLRYRWTRAICMHSAHELCIFVYLHARVFPTVGTHISSSRPPAATTTPIMTEQRVADRAGGARSGLPKFRD
jgi:hypothetical protein